MCRGIKHNGLNKVFNYLVLHRDSKTTLLIIANSSMPTINGR